MSIDSLNSDCRGAIIGGRDYKAARCHFKEGQDKMVKHKRKSNATRKKSLRRTNIARMPGISANHSLKGKIAFEMEEQERKDNLQMEIYCERKIGFVMNIFEALIPIPDSSKVTQEVTNLLGAIKSLANDSDRVSLMRILLAVTASLEYLAVDFPKAVRESASTDAAQSSTAGSVSLSPADSARTAENARERLAAARAAAAKYYENLEHLKPKRFN